MTPYQYWLGKLLLLIAGALTERIVSIHIKNMVIHKLERMELELDKLERKEP